MFYKTDCRINRLLDELRPEKNTNNITDYHDHKEVVVEDAKNEDKTRIFFKYKSNVIGKEVTYCISSLNSTAR